MKRLDLIVRNATLVASTGRRSADIGIADGRFAALTAAGALHGTAAADVLDATGLHALPSVIDGHVHFREPGLEAHETWLSGSRAAVMGGVTTVLEMPNTVPPTDSVARARHKLELAGASAYCDFGLFGLLGPAVDAALELAVSGVVVGLKVFLGPTTGNLSAPGHDGLRRGLLAARQAGMRVAFHAEDRSTIAATERAIRATGRTDALAHLESRPVEAEVRAIDEVARLLQATGAAGHILHVSSADGLVAVNRWRSAGVDLSCEATPHHALLDVDAYERFGGRAKVNPPFRGRHHARLLSAALETGEVDCVASDHAPHRADDKARESIWDVPAGIAGVETLLPLMLSEVAAGRLSLERLAYLTSEGPARAWRLWPHKGAVQIGADADLTLVDLAREGVVRAADLHGKSNTTPFEGRHTRGTPVATIVRGRVVMLDGRLVGEAGWGRPVSRS